MNARQIAISVVLFALSCGLCCEGQPVSSDHAGHAAEGSSPGSAAPVPHVVPAGDTRGEFEVRGIQAFAISPGGDIWAGSADGRLYVSRDWNKSWSEVAIGTHRDDEFGLSNEELDHLGFFDSEHALLAGYIGGDQRDEVLRTQDGGRTWTRAKLPHDIWVYDMKVSPDGHAWIVGSTGGLYVSADYGATWKATIAPFDGESRSNRVDFTTANRGAVGGLSGGLRWTEDGGRTWASLEPPPEIEEEDDAQTNADAVAIAIHFGGPIERVSGVWLLGDRIFVLQKARLFARDLPKNTAWREVRVRGRRVIAADRDGDGLVMATDDLRICRLTASLETVETITATAPSYPWQFAASSRGITLVTDRRGEVCVLDEQGLRCSRMHSEGDARTWPLRSFDRTADGTLFGVSASALYRSKDSGATWERLFEGNGFESVHASVDGQFAVVRCDSRLLSWRPGASTLDPISIADTEDASLRIVARRGHLWVATTLVAAKDGVTQRMLSTTDTVLVGPGFTALAFASADDGRSWRRVDRYVGGIATASWLGRDDMLTLCMSDGSVRRARLDPTTPSAWPNGFEELSSERSNVGGQWGSWIAFPESAEGWAGGRTFFEGPRAQHSLDGGRTWTQLSSSEEREDIPLIDTFLVGGTHCVRLVQSWRGPSHIERWKDGGFQTIRTIAAEVHDAVIDSTGCLLVRQRNAEVLRLDVDGESWTTLGRVPLAPE